MIALRLVHLPQGPATDCRRWLVGAQGVTIGRADDCTLVLPDLLRMVSRLHARVDLHEGVARLRCLSASTPVWLNRSPIGLGADVELHPGDRLRIGAYELVVDAVTTANGSAPAPAIAPATASTPPLAPVSAAARTRLDDWFDLQTAADPLGPGSPLPEIDGPALPAEIDSASPAAVMSAPPGVLPRVRPLRPVTDTVASDTGHPPAAPDPDPQAVAQLLAAFMRGAGLTSTGVGPPALTPQWMHQLGQVLRTATEGTLALLQSRATLKDGMGLEGTRIAQIQNNPLKFVPDAQAALEHLLGLRSLRGYLAPVEALRDANEDLLIHHLAVMAGMRAAVFELFERLGPDAVLEEQGAAKGWARWLPTLHDAALWRRHRLRHERFQHSLDDDFEAVFGRQFKRAYEAQSRGLEHTRPLDDTTAPPR